MGLRGLNLDCPAEIGMVEQIAMGCIIFSTNHCIFYHKNVMYTGNCYFVYGLTKFFFLRKGKKIICYRFLTQSKLL